MNSHQEFQLEWHSGTACRYDILVSGLVRGHIRAHLYVRGFRKRDPNSAASETDSDMLFNSRPQDWSVPEKLLLSIRECD